MNEFWRTFWMVAPFLSGALQVTATALVIAACLKYLFSAKRSRRLRCPHPRRPALARAAATADLRAGTALPARRGRRENIQN